MTIDLRKPVSPAPANPARVLETPAPVREMPRARNLSHRRKERAVYGLAAIAIGIIVLLLVGFGTMKLWGYLFGGTEAEVRALVSDVGEHMLLPENETPNVATVSDMHALEGQLFFKNAQLGDKVLMYMTSKKAIIYRPSIDKIVEVGPITAEQ